MVDSYFSGQRRVRAIILTKRKTVVLIRKESHKPDEDYQYIAPGGMVRDDDPDDITALRRELREQLGAEVQILKPAMTLFMDRWSFFLCGLSSVDAEKRAPEHNDAMARGEYEIVELRLNETAIRGCNIHPRALLDYLLANYDKFYRTV
ncbi:MAG: NUDIX domain-containing protein [Aggregatilineales bacterium]